ncbi:hypothetical protein SAMN04487887_113108, partial [Enterococcus casseliflavus]
MVYQRHFWKDYDESKTETQNIKDGAVVTTEKLNEMEVGIDSKADRNDLNVTNQNVLKLETNKVDKGGNEQVTLGMLSQSVKEAMTGGSVAVVGPNSVNTTNIVDGATTRPKFADTVTNEFNNYAEDNISKCFEILHANFIQPGENIVNYSNYLGAIKEMV